MRVSWIDLGLSAAVLGTLLSGCSAEDLSQEGDDGTSGVGPLGSSTGGESQATDGLDETGEAGDTSGTPQPPGDESGTGGATCDIDCGEGGSCDLDEDGAPYCVCDSGHAAYGLRCLPCTPSAGGFDVDVPTVEVTATFMLGDGEPFPGSIYEWGRVLLRDPASGDEIEIGDTYNRSATATVLPGTYDVLYAWKLGSTIVPANRGAKVATVKLEGPAQEIVVEVPVVELTGSFTFNDETPPTSIYENGAIVLVDPATGDEVPLGDTRDGTYQVRVIPGLYQVHYRRKVAETVAPRNADAHIGTIVVETDGDAQSMDIDVPVSMLTGTFTLDGQAPPTSIYENGRILLRNTATGEEVMLGTTAEGDFTAPVVAGPYQVIYQRLQGGQFVPVNRAALLQEVAIEGGPRTLDIDIQTAVITGDITVASEVPPADPGDDGLVLLRNPDTGDEAILGNTAVGSYTQRVVRGSYDLYYRQETSSGGVPVNTNALLESDVAIRGGASLDVDVPMVTVSALVTVDGQTPPDSVYDDGVLYLRNHETGDSVLLGNTRLAALQRPVVPGTYDVLYVVEAAGPTMPINASSRLTTVEVGPGTALELDIPVIVAQGVIAVDGGPPSPSIYNRAALHLHDVATGDVVYLGAVESGGFARTLTAGTYVIVYQMLATTGFLPANVNAGVACVELTGG